MSPMKASSSVRYFCAIAGALVTTVASAQMGVIATFGGSPTMQRSINFPSMTLFDFDGPGAGQPQLVVAESEVMRLEGDAWVRVGPSDFRSRGGFVEVMDPDGAGPLPRSLVVIGRTNATGAWVGLLTLVNGDWVPVQTPSGLPPSIGSTGLWGMHHSTVYDPDGAGPLQEELVAMLGVQINGVTGAHIARWNGAGWTSLGTTSMSLFEVSGLETYDEDGAGPIRPAIFLSSRSAVRINGATLTSALARYDDTHGWQGVGGFSEVSSQAVHDLDGDGPANGVLAIGRPDGVSTWNGASFQFYPQRPWSGSNAEIMRSIDLDGPGPQAPVLAQASVSGVRSLSFLGGELIEKPILAPSLPNGEQLVDVVVRPGNGRELFALQQGCTGSSCVAEVVRSADGGPWSGVTRGLASAVDLTIDDPDGDGPLGRTAIAWNATDRMLTRSPGMMYWTGDRWSPTVDAGLAFREIGRSDADGAGPLPEVIFRARSASDVMGIDIERGGVRSLYASPANSADDTTVLDAGAQTPRLVVLNRSTGNIVRFAGGSFGEEWEVLPALAGATEVEAIDPDGAGSALETLYAGTSAGELYRFRGGVWELVETPASTGGAGIDRLIAFPLGSVGDQGEQLVIRKNNAWHRLTPNGWSVLPTVHPSVELVVFDPDGAGPRRAELVGRLGKDLHRLDGVSVRTVALPYNELLEPAAFVAGVSGGWKAARPLVARAGEVPGELGGRPRLLITHGARSLLDRAGSLVLAWAPDANELALSVVPSERTEGIAGRDARLFVEVVGRTPFSYEWHHVTEVVDEVIGENRAFVDVGIELEPRQYYAVVRSGGETVRTPMITVIGRLCSIADVARGGQLEGPSGDLTADDIIVFVRMFFDGDARADFAGAGQTPGADGDFTPDDIIMFIGAFFQGC